MEIKKPLISIEYCPRCGWLLRAAYMAQELLTTFTEDVAGVVLIPSEKSGTYVVCISDVPVFDRKIMGHFPEAKELKQLVRDIISPMKNLGHSDR